jgi:hypothetical protein
LYTQGFVELSTEAYNKEFNSSFQLLKHKQLKLLVLEGLQFTRLLYVRSFLNYWKELKNMLAGGNFREAALLPVSNVSEFSLLVQDLRKRIESSSILSLSDGFNNTSTVITYLDLILLVIIFRVVFKEFHN